MEEKTEPHLTQKNVRVNWIWSTKILPTQASEYECPAIFKVGYDPILAGIKCQNIIEYINYILLL
jgi:hypothetical protein